MVNVLSDATRVVFDDERVVANAGVMLPASFAVAQQGGPRFGSFAEPVGQCDSSLLVPRGLCQAFGLSGV
jgi:hypothetical protein